jgi:hypothetical protein
LHARGGSDEQFVSQHLPQSRQRVTDGGLAEAKLLTGTKDATLFHHGIEHSQKVEVERTEGDGHLATGLSGISRIRLAFGVFMTVDRRR